MGPVPFFRFELFSKWLQNCKIHLKLYKHIPLKPSIDEINSTPPELDRSKECSLLFRKACCCCSDGRKIMC